MTNGQESPAGPPEEKKAAGHARQGGGAAEELLANVPWRRRPWDTRSRGPPESKQAAGHAHLVGGASGKVLANVPGRSRFAGRSARGNSRHYFFERICPLSNCHRRSCTALAHATRDNSRARPLQWATANLHMHFTKSPGNSFPEAFRKRSHYCIF